VSRASIVVALVATFLIGASLGLMGGIAFTMARHRPAPFWIENGRGGGPGMFRPGRPPGPDRAVPRTDRILRRMHDALDLTDAQVARIRPLIDEAHQTMGAARDSLRARIDRVLTPEQRDRLRRLEARRGVPGEPRGPEDRAHRAQPGDEGDSR
jgi:Spy/CpxP family protein refolding chaperone